VTCLSLDSDNNRGSKGNRHFKEVRLFASTTATTLMYFPWASDMILLAVNMGRLGLQRAFLPGTASVVVLRLTRTHSGVPPTSSNADSTKSRASLSTPENIATTVSCVRQHNRFDANASKLFNS